MIRKLFTIAGSLILLALPLRPAQAQLFGGPCYTADGPCSGLLDQVAQYARQLLQLIQETETTIDEDLAALTLPFGLFRDVSQDIAAVSAIVKQADLLIGNPGLLIQNLTAQVYPLPANGMQQLILHSNTVGGAISTLGQAINNENRNLAAASATLAALSAEALANLGRHQTLQDQAQIQAAHAQQLQSLEAIKMAEAQAQHATLLADHDRRAMADQWGDLAATAYTPYPMTGQAF